MQSVLLQHPWSAKNLMSKGLGIRLSLCGHGEGADELFAGYPAFKRDMFLHGLKEETPEVRAGYQAALERTNQLFKGAILAENQRSHPSWEQIWGLPIWISHGWILDLARPLLSDDLQDELKEYDPIAEIADRLDASMLEGRHPLDRAQYTWSKCQLEGQILNWEGTVWIWQTQWSRPAFLDHHLAEIAVKIPPNLRIHGNVEKYVLREAVRGVLPEVLYKREKFAFMAPPLIPMRVSAEKWGN